MALEAFCDEVKDLTNFKPFIICGGPCPKGTGSIEISQYVLVNLHRDDLLTCLSALALENQLWGVKRFSNT